MVSRSPQSALSSQPQQSAVIRERTVRRLQSINGLYATLAERVHLVARYACRENMLDARTNMLAARIRFERQACSSECQAHSNGTVRRNRNGIMIAHLGCEDLDCLVLQRWQHGHRGVWVLVPCCAHDCPPVQCFSLSIVSCALRIKRRQECSED